ncbi:MAG TPA: MBL fold metallo-hydrolase [Pseudosphingobacterium sp.]|nr:MBL fold metallo-hydrolase [Pseudosphingobacterium sp.]
MKIEQIYTGCLAQGAYYVESDGEAVVIDPLREVAPYLKRASADGARIKYVLETHFHADFVSGHIDLAKESGAIIVYGPTAKPDFKAHIATDGEILQVGKLSFKVIHTPGHTLESTCYLLQDEKMQPIALFTGDTLFIGDVGRPDLAQKVVADLTQEKLAGMLYDSLRQKILPLNDRVIIYPAHGAGSACGKNMSKETSDTLGNQKLNNYALQPMDKETFIRKVTEGLLPPPAYFPANVKMNIHGYEAVGKVLQRGMNPLNSEAFEQVANESGALILDTRNAQLFAKAFIPNSINIGIDGSFAPWVGALITDINQAILIVAEEGREEEVVTRLARVGYDHTLGYLKNGITDWIKSGKEVDHIESIDAKELSEQISQHGATSLLDVRKQGEYQSEHVIGARNLPVDFINEHLKEINKGKTHYVHCASGYRSMIFTSILRARGYNNLIDVRSGFKAIKESGLFPLSEYVCPSTLL